MSIEGYTSIYARQQRHVADGEIPELSRSNGYFALSSKTRTARRTLLCVGSHDDRYAVVSHRGAALSPVDVVLPVRGLVQPQLHSPQGQ